MPPPENSRRFSIFGFGDSWNDVEGGRHKKNEQVFPILKLQTDMNVYRPGDDVWVTIELQNLLDQVHFGDDLGRSFLVDRLSFELRGIEKLDTQWFSTQKPAPGSKQRRGEHVFLDSSTPSLVVNQIISPEDTKKYVVRTVLPSIIPPSYRGTTIRYFYYVRAALSGRWLVDNCHTDKDLIEDVTGLEARVPLQIWVSQKASGLLLEEGESNGTVPIQTIQTDLYWKEMDGDSEWVRANEADDGVEEGDEASRDETLSVSSYNPSRESIHKSFGSSLSLNAAMSRSFNREPLHAEADEVLHDSSGVVSPSRQRRYSKSFSEEANDVSMPSPRGTAEAGASEAYNRGRSYNIRLDDQVLIRFSPKKSDLNYYFGDTIGGTLTFFNEEGTRRCLEISITLEISETIPRHFVHPSRRNSPIITKVQSDHHEVVADILQTSFQFSIPMDGPMSFSTARVSLQWSLRFEFFTTPKSIDWTRYEHPLLVEGRDKCEWILPITVHAPQPGTQAAQARTRNPLSFEPLWARD